MLLEEQHTTYHWNYPDAPQDLVNHLSESLNISSALAGLLIRLGINEPLKAQRFLYPRLSHLEDPFKLTNLEDAVHRILTAVKKKEKIVIVGDYDVDGVTSTTLLSHTLEFLGVTPSYIIPRRLEEGYGFTIDAINRGLKKSKDASLFIALDCGTNSADEVAYLREKNVDVIIIDHHQSNNGNLPQDCTLINPHVFDGDNVPWVNLCAVGLVFKLIHGIIKVLKEDNDPRAENFQVKDLLDLVALGTVSDLVPLLDENRIMVAFGLGKVQHNNRPGLQALCKVSGLPDGQPVKPADIAFRLGPRINASGRLSDAALPVDMLLGSDVTQCTDFALQLDSMNKERQEIERQVTTEADTIIRESGMNYEPGIVVYSEDWHPGVVGIVAGKLSRMHNRPTIVLGKEGTLAKGSGRSIPGVDLIEALSQCADLLEGWGGHPMAAGLSLKKKDLTKFKKLFIDAISAQVEGAIPAPSIDIAQVITPEDLTESLLEELELLQPFGMHNPEPVFAVHGAILPSPAQVFSKNHIKFQINKNTGMPVNGVGWKMASNIPPHGTPINLAVKFAYNNWNGRKIPQIELIDWKPSQ